MGGISTRNCHCWVPKKVGYFFSVVEWMDWVGSMLLAVVVVAFFIVLLVLFLSMVFVATENVGGGP